MPIVILIIFLVLYFTYHSFKEALVTMITVPFALIGESSWSISTA